MEVCVEKHVGFGDDGSLGLLIRGFLNEKFRDFWRAFLNLKFWIEILGNSWKIPGKPLKIPQ
jgi:hypothetical protein